MKKALVALALAGLAATASAAIQNGPHDLSSTGPWPATLAPQISSCQFCHAPHNVNTAVTGAPLWNRNTVTGQTWQMYTSATLMNPGRRTDAEGPNVNSATCLSCHDGTTDMGDTYTGSNGYAGAVTLANAAFGGATNSAIVGTDLRNDHPVSVRYVEGGTYNAASAARTAGIRFYSYSGFDYVECGSCHDPHNHDRTGGGYAPFLRVAKASMCTTCHNY